MLAVVVMRSAKKVRDRTGKEIPCADARRAKTEGHMLHGVTDQN